MCLKCLREAKHPGRKAGELEKCSEQTKQHKMQDLNSHDRRRPLKITPVAGRGTTGCQNQEKQRITPDERTANAVSGVQRL